MTFIGVRVFVGPVKGSKAVECKPRQKKDNEAKWTCGYCNKGILDGFSRARCSTCKYFVTYWIQEYDLPNIIIL